MLQQSAGILLYRIRGDKPEVFLAHPGGPFYYHRDTSVWSIPKGLIEEDEKPLEAARREFREETGFDVDGPFLDLGTVRLRSRKIVHAWAREQDVDPGQLVSHTFTMEWPRHSGNTVEFPEMDRAAWFDMETARRKITPGQIPFLDRLVKKLGPTLPGAARPPSR
ncbi:MAG TPA: NUDIX domain-containing protein [Chromatiales bacterium]|nr:NUDIX domain-containing protein [Chromatiales bacterium]